MGRRANKRNGFEESAMMNNRTYGQYLMRLTELSVSMFDWQNLPDTIDPRFLELTLFNDGQAVFFYDEVLGHLALQCAMNGGFDVYRIPTKRRAYAVNGYQRQLDNTNSVIIWNNFLHTNSVLDVRQFAKRLNEFDRIIDVNAKAQKTPVVLQGTEQQRLTLMNLYKAYDGNEPFIFGDKNLDINALKSISTQAPFISKEMYDLKTAYWNEALTYLGISNLNIMKRERLLTDEVSRSIGGTLASRYSRLESRREACKKINEMFGLDIWCDYRDDTYDIGDDTVNAGDTESEDNSEVSADE